LQLFPATQAMNAFKGLVMGGVADFDPLGSVIALLSSGLLASGLAVHLLGWDRRNAVRSSPAGAAGLAALCNGVFAG